MMIMIIRVIATMPNSYRNLLRFSAATAALATQTALQQKDKEKVNE
jgi:hypothetical protein